MRPRVLCRGEGRRGPRTLTGVTVSFSIASLLYFEIPKITRGPRGALPRNRTARSAQQNIECAQTGTDENQSCKNARCNPSTVARISRSRRQKHLYHSEVDVDGHDQCKVRDHLGHLYFRIPKTISGRATGRLANN